MPHHSAPRQKASPSELRLELAPSIPTLASSVLTAAVTIIDTARWYSSSRDEDFVHVVVADVAKRRASEAVICAHVDAF